MSLGTHCQANSSAFRRSWSRFCGQRLRSDSGKSDLARPVCADRRRQGTPAGQLNPPDCKIHASNWKIAVYGPKMRASDRKIGMSDRKIAVSDRKTRVSDRKNAVYGWKTRVSDRKIAVYG